MLDNEGCGGAVLMDLLNTKFHVYRYSEESLKLIKSYLTNRWQRIKLSTGFSKWTETLLGEPLWSLLGRLLEAGETTFYTCDSDLHNLILTYSFYPVTSTNVVIILQNFLTFSFNRVASWSSGSVKPEDHA